MHLLQLRVALQQVLVPDSVVNWKRVEDTYMH